MEISVEKIKELREQSGAGVMECRNILRETDGNLGKALEVLKERSLVKAEKKSQRVARQGLVETYIHTGGRIGAMIELNCETDFVARTDDFQKLSRDLALQVASANPKYLKKEDAPKDLTEEEVAPVPAG